MIKTTQMCRVLECVLTAVTRVVFGKTATLAKKLMLKKCTYAADSTYTQNTDNMEGIHKTLTFILN